MHVGIVTAPLDYSPSGPGVYLRNLSERLATYDEIDVTLIHYHDTDDPLYEQADEVVISRVPGLFERAVANLDLDVLHYNYIPYKRPLVFALDTNLVVTLHGDLPFVLPDYASFGQRYLGVPIQRLYSKVGLLDGVDAFISVSETVGSNVADALDIPHSKMRTVYSGVDEQFRPVDDAAATVESRYDIDPPYLLNVNNYMKVKNRRTLIKAFDRIRDVRPEVSLVLAGRGWNESDIPDLVSHRGLNAAVEDLGFVPTEALPALYSGAALYVNPTLHETFGFTNVEAMACGCPVITSDRFAVPEIVDNGARLLSNPQDPQSLADTMLELLTDDERRGNLAQRGRQRAAEFSWDRTRRETVGVYRSLD